MIDQYTVAIPDIIDSIYKLQSKYPSDNRSNVLGWQSKQYGNFKELAWAEPLVTACLTAMNTHRSVHKFWFNVNPTGAYHTWHSHGTATTVGVLYLQTPENCGDIEFKMNKQVSAITPHAGLLLIFPSGTGHRVLANNSNENRISLAFNLID
jgi:hypothetical protein